MKKLILTLAILLSANVANAVEAKSAVLDRNGDPVRSIVSESCVRHAWNEGTDVCAPPAPEPEPVVLAPEPEPAPQPVALLTKDQLTVYFDFNKHNIRPSETAKLDNVIQALVASEGVESLSIVGFADRIGSVEANLKLSKKRTAAVQDYLNSRVTIPTEIVNADAKGESVSVTNCDDKEKRANLISCLQGDRRAEIVVNYYKF